jgi:hypothetical protein
MYLYSSGKYPLTVPKRLQDAVNYLIDPDSDFGPVPPTLATYLTTLSSSKDPVARSIITDWDSYCGEQELLEREYFTEDENGMFRSRTMSCLFNSGEFSSDNTVNNLCSNVWKTDPIEVPQPALSEFQRVRSQSCLRLDANTFYD